MYTNNIWLSLLGHCYLLSFANSMKGHYFPDKFIYELLISVIGQKLSGLLPLFHTLPYLSQHCIIVTVNTKQLSFSENMITSTKISARFKLGIGLVSLEGYHKVEILTKGTIILYCTKYFKGKRSPQQYLWKKFHGCDHHSYSIVLLHVTIYRENVCR